MALVEGWRVHSLAITSAQRTGNSGTILCQPIVIKHFSFAGFEPATIQSPQQSRNWRIRKQSSDNLTLPISIPQRSLNVSATTPISPHNGDSAAIFCDWERFNASCGSEEVLIVTRARYGRMNLNRCVTKDYGHVGCGDDVTNHFERTCSARQSCDMSVISLQGLMASCPREFKAYVEVSYYCIAGTTDYFHLV